MFLKLKHSSSNYYCYFHNDWIIYFTFLMLHFIKYLLVKSQISNKSWSKVTDEHHNTDTKYNQRLTIRILNGKYKTRITTVNNHFVKSQADSEQFAKTKSIITYKKVHLTLPF